MAFHDHSHQIKTNTYKLSYIYRPNLDGCPKNFQNRSAVVKQILSDPQPESTSPTLSGHDHSYPRRTNIYGKPKVRN